MHTGNSSILIIGGAGYIGSALSIYMRGAGYTVDTADLEWFGAASFEGNKKTDMAELSADFFAQYKTVVLLAGHSSVAMCACDMESSFKNNVANFVSLISKIHPEQKFIYASSSSVYGTQAPDLCTEEYPAYAAGSYYDLSKHTIDLYSQLSGKNYYGLRFATVNGASPHLRTDLMINSMYHSAQTLGIISLSNPQIRRPILGTNDACRAIEAIIKADEDHPGLYNLASFNSTAGDIASEVGALLNTPIELKENAPLAGGTPAPKPYDFSISSEKFMHTYDFTFGDSVASIVESLANSYDSAKKTVRSQAYPY